jgi:hypothetical protein
MSCVNCTCEDCFRHVDIANAQMFFRAMNSTTNWTSSNTYVRQAWIAFAVKARKAGMCEARLILKLGNG